MLTGVGRRVMAYAAVVAVLALSGCSSDDAGASPDESPAPTVTQTMTETAAPSESASESPSESLSAPPIDGPVVEVGQLSSPSGNIWCSLDYGIECEVRQNSYPPLRKPDDCQLDWAENQFWVNGSTGARGICRGDVTFTSRPPELAYGSTSVVEDRACQSSETAMTCWDTTTGHGFRVSREDYGLF